MSQTQNSNGQNSRQPSRLPFTQSDAKSDAKSDGQRAREPFTLYPAIDILGAACVRLFKGDYAASTTYEANPRAVAQRWLDQGARFLHVVDLDAAKSGSPVNRDVIRDIVKLTEAVGASVQVGGGVRDEDAMNAWLQIGVTRCVIGTAALDTNLMARFVERFGGDRIVAGLDGRDGKLAVRGWIEQTDISLVDVARQLYGLGISSALVTDVQKDGTLQGPNLELARAIAETGMAAIASGGVRNLEDILAARDAGLSGAIAGRALYDGTLNLAEAVQTLGALAEE
ncbi:1-(5-phosphoribosyl)-5-[(5-phosphoribosylamino)methylideneamino]imidazole-4-carboxamide isomerase [Alicyclobacillus curvatus]|nr:1-(5-phosphoribosyl)-5-[(5-phosphoribosylamino)methylideneamino]imidazole-4-carboxamide isomerase [Alicyclobacillus curvatus]